MSVYRKKLRFTVIKRIEYPFCDFPNHMDSISQLLYVQQLVSN